tara:strand:- start:339 stop:572 length:234 start_codon:yes stop_codon:yes gene_type:complete
MSEINPEGNSEKTAQPVESKQNKLDIMDFADTDKKSLFKFFGIELVAPKGLENASLIYLLFLVINVVIFVTLISKLG